MTHPPWIYVNS